MRTIFKKISILLLLFIYSFSVAAADKSEWEVARNLYVEGKFQESLSHFTQLESDGFASWQLFYNMANCHFKLNQVGKAILYYERALKLNPTNRDILFNLEFTKRFTIDKLDSVPEFVVKSWFRKINYSLSSNRWAYISLIAALFTIIALLGFRYGPNRRVRKGLFFIALLLSSIFIVSLLFSVTQKRRYYNDSEAVVMAAVATVRNSPDKFGTTLFILHEGTKVTRIEPLEEWSKIVLSDGREGWTLSEDLEFI